MVEVCQHHSELVESVGEIKGTVKMIHEVQKKMADDIEQLCKDTTTNERNSAVEKQKIKPFYIAVTLVIAVVLTKIGENLIDFVLRALK
jgi:F0F1-type ATP synthase assembly protein I